jgi:uncharacterized membrane protein YphA (DoxX/SURF4 family)
MCCCDSDADTAWCHALRRWKEAFGHNLRKFQNSCRLCENAYPIVNRGEAAILFCFIFLLFAFTGAGPWSIAALRKAA